MKPLKAAIAAALLTAAGTVVRPARQRHDDAGELRRAHQQVQHGVVGVGYRGVHPGEVAWIASTSTAISRLKYYYEYGGKAHLSGDTYTLVVDVPDGLRCPGQVLPSRDTYTWNQVTLAGEINSTYDVGCFGGPPGTQFWTFALQRL